METRKRTKFTKDAAHLIQLIGEHDIGGLVFGLPVEMDGAEGPRCQSTRQFAANLEQALADAGMAPLPMTFWDERLSTAAVERVLIGQADLTRKRRAEVVDKAAAGWILQGALDALSRLGRNDR
jgi:putative Holliday junction resolvase